MERVLREVFNPDEATIILHRLRELRHGYPRDAYDCLALMGMELFRGASLFVLETEGDVAGFATIHVGRRRKNCWEPYANWTLAYTTPAQRRKGHALALSRFMLAHVAFLGCRRVKSKVGSYLGLRLHSVLGHDIWGVLPTGELQVDAPLEHAGQFPVGRTPMGARSCNTRGYPLARDEIDSIIRERAWCDEDLQSQKR
jgi:GNAT superfamily N-acetyltransferase